MTYSLEQFYEELLGIKNSNIPIADTLIFGVCKEYHNYFPSELSQDDYPLLSQFITPYFQYADLTLTYEQNDPRIDELTPSARKFAVKIFTDLYNAEDENTKQLGMEALLSLRVLNAR